MRSQGKEKKWKEGKIVEEKEEEVTEMRKRIVDHILGLTIAAQVAVLVEIGIRVQLAVVAGCIYTVGKRNIALIFIVAVRLIVVILQVTVVAMEVIVVLTLLAVVAIGGL